MSFIMTILAQVTDNGMFGVFKSLDLDTEQGVYHISRYLVFSAFGQTYEFLLLICVIT